MPTTPPKQRLIPVVIAIVVPTIVTWIYFDLLADSAPSLQQSAYGIGKALQFLFPICWVLFIARQSFRDAGLPQRDGEVVWSRAVSLAVGVGMGVAVVAAMWAVYKAAFPPELLTMMQAEISTRVQRMGVSGWQGFAVMGLFYAIFHSFMEEYYFRWFVFGQMRHFASLTTALIVSGLAFMAHHVLVLAHYFNGLSAATILLSLCIAIGGIIWAWQYERSKSLLGPWVSHLIVDAGIFWIGYDLVKDALAT